MNGVGAGSNTDGVFDTAVSCKLFFESGQIGPIEQFDRQKDGVPSLLELVLYGSILSRKVQQRYLYCLMRQLLLRQS